MPPFQKSAVFLNIVQTGGGGQPMFKNYVGNCRVFWRSFNNMKFAWKGTFEALMVKFEGKIGTLYQIFTPCTPLPKYKRAFTWFWGGPIACQDAEGFFTKKFTTWCSNERGGGQRLFEQCSKKLHFSLMMASLIYRHAGNCLSKIKQFEY